MFSIVGIDPGLAVVGFGVIAVEENNIHAVSYGCITTSADKSKGERLLRIYNHISTLFEKYAPHAIAMERIFFSRNVTNAFSVAEVRGVIFLAAQQHRLPVFEYTPLQIKQAITGSGKADKRQMQDMIKKLLGLKEIPKPDDAADGLSIALCHIHTKL